MRASLAIAAIVSSLALAAIGCASDDRVEPIARVKQKTIDAKTADAQYGQPDFTTGTAQPPDHGVNAPGGLAIDANTGSFAGRVYVADTGNHRFFAVEQANLSSRFDDSLFGQKSWSDSAPDGGTFVDEAHVDGPTFSAKSFDQWLVADTHNHRVLVGYAGTFSATWVFGQLGSFTSHDANKGGIGPGTLSSPTGVAFLPSSRGYVIADSGNHRVVVYTFTGTAATWVLGQADFTTNLPNRGAGITSDGLDDPRGVVRATPYDLSQVPDPRLEGIFVVDRGNHRVLHFKWTPGFEGGDFPTPTADGVWGQTSFATGDPGVGPDRLNAPTAIAIDPNNGFWVADTGNHRVLHFPYGSHAADKVIGQPDFDHGDPPTSTSATTLDAPQGLAVAPNGDLFVADTGANRILKFAFDVGDSCDDGDPCTDDTLGALGCLHTLVQDSTACFPYECDVSQRQCATDCRTFGLCQAPYLCFGSKCLKACSPGSTCEIGYCADGICCDTPCTGICEACNVPGFEGTCHAFSDSPATHKPFARCESPTGDLECAGSCDGIHRDVCLPTTKGTQCGATFCKDGVASRGGACDGFGSCVADRRDCFPYACGAAECRTSCTSNDQCADGAQCASGLCQSTSTAYAPVGGSCVASSASFVRVDRWVLLAIASLALVARRRRRTS